MISSNERGEFAFRAVPPGSYTVRIELGTKATFGTALGIQSPTAPPRVMQLSARFTF